MRYLKSSIFFLFIILFCTTTKGNNKIFVSPSGKDSNSGSISSPLASIKQALNQISTGDTLYLRAGNYHIQDTIYNIDGTKENPYIITPYNNEKVTFDGSQTVGDISTGDWTKYKDHIYKITLTKDIWEVFVDGEWMMLARWPNAGFHDGKAWNRRFWAEGNEEKSTEGKEYDAPHDDIDLAASKLDMTGAMAILNVYNFSTYARKVDLHKAGQNNFTYSPNVPLKPVYHYYFFDSKLNLLDCSREWYYDPTSKTLYLWAPDGNKPSLNVRVKNQTHALTFENCSFIKVKDLDFFSTTFQASKSNNLTFEDCGLKYPCFNKRTLGEIGAITGSFFYNCKYINILNCSFAYTDGLVIKFQGGSHNTVENCLLHDLDYTVAHHDGNSGFIWFRSSPYATFKRNNVYKTGASEGIMASSYANIILNQIHDIAPVQSDGSMVHYMQGSFYTKTQFNWFYNNTKTCLRLTDGPKDEASLNKNMVTGLARNNVSFGTDNHNFMIKGDKRNIVNQLTLGYITLADDSKNPIKSGIHANSIAANNVVSFLTRKGSVDTPAGGKQYTNWESYKKGDIKSQVCDWDNRDFRPKPNSPWIDAGTVFKDTTASYIGKSIDIGAYEYGDSIYWIPGRQIGIASQPVPMNGNMTMGQYVNLMWLKAYKAKDSNVYFGTNKNDVSSATTSSKQYKGTYKNNIYAPGPLIAGLTYYWRIDDIVNGKIRKGDVWSFTCLNNADANINVSITVSDDKGIIKDATVSLDNKALQTNASGKVMFTDVTAMKFLTLSVEKTGYKTTCKYLTLSEDTNYNITLEKETTDTKIIKDIKFDIYPNPATNNLIINCKGENAQIEIIGIDGIMYSRHNLKSGENNIFVGNLKPGAYICTLKQNRDLIKSKIIFIKA